MSRGKLSYNYLKQIHPLPKGEGFSLLFWIKHAIVLLEEKKEKIDHKINLLKEKL